MKNICCVRLTISFSEKKNHFEIYKGSPACPSDKNNINTKKSMKCWWNNTDSRKKVLINALVKH